MINETSEVASVGSTSITPYQQMLSSCSGALLTSIFVTPMDVVKIRLQAQQKEFMRNKCFLYCNGLMEHICYCVNGNNGSNIQQQSHAYHSQSYNSFAPQVNNQKWFRRPGHFNGTVDAFIKITRNEGLASLWSGLPPTLVMAIPATVIYFTVYDQLREQLNLTLGYTKQPIWVPVIAGGSARIFAATTISPLEMIRTKMQSKKLSYLEVARAVNSLIKTNGIFSLWRGLSATILRDVPFSCIYWANYEFFKQHFNQPNPAFGFSFIAGATSGCIAAIITLPFDVVKTHRQIELGEMDVIAQNKHQVNSVKEPSRTKDIMAKIYQKHGFKALFTGMVPRLIKVAPACAIMISTYEFGKSFFKQYNARHLID